MGIISCRDISHNTKMGAFTFILVILVSYLHITESLPQYPVIPYPAHHEDVRTKREADPTFGLLSALAPWCPFCPEGFRAEQPGIPGTGALSPLTRTPVFVACCG